MLGFLKGFSGRSISSAVSSLFDRAALRAKVKAHPIGGYAKAAPTPTLNRYGGLLGSKAPEKTLQQARAERFARMREQQL